MHMVQKQTRGGQCTNIVYNNISFIQIYRFLDVANASSMPHLLRNHLLRIFLFYSTIPSCLEAEKSVEFNFSTYVIPQNFTTSRNSNVLQAGHLQKLCGTVCFIAATFPSLPLSSKQLHLWFSADPCVARSAHINIKNFWKSRILRTLRLFIIKTTASLVLSRPVLPGRLI